MNKLPSTEDMLIDVKWQERIAELEQQNAELVAALEKIAAMDYRKSAVNLFGRIAHEIIDVALSKVKQP